MTEKSRGTVAYTRHKISSVSHMESESWYRVDMVTWWQQAHKDKTQTLLALPGLCPSPQGPRWQHQHSRKQDRGDKKWEPVVCSEAGTWHFCLHPIGQNWVTWPYLAAKEPGEGDLYLSSPICPGTQSVTMGKGEGDCWNMSSSSCHTTASPLPVPHCSVQRRDSFVYYLFSRLLLNKCLFNWIAGRWKIGWT